MMLHSLVAEFYKSEKNVQILNQCSISVQQSSGSMCRDPPMAKIFVTAP
jgi:hypothetical protein